MYVELSWSRSPSSPRYLWYLDRKSEGNGRHKTLEGTTEESLFRLCFNSKKLNKHYMHLFLTLELGWKVGKWEGFDSGIEGKWIRYCTEILKMQNRKMYLTQTEGKYQIINWLQWNNLSQPYHCCLLIGYAVVNGKWYKSLKTESVTKDWHLTKVPCKIRNVLMIFFKLFWTKTILKCMGKLCASQGCIWQQWF